ncbi:MULTISPECIES: response regulator [Pseudoalteromonas]|uniref:Response regulator n=1 Tax=Pseudoalteromonas viridis TaxID=339617 RepID=A0ABX7V1N4_9GAMM|nr:MULTISPECIES: response regulator [Pseudoalteromonas]QTL34783.1 response regulator [Pseudoalteromonas viridis]
MWSNVEQVVVRNVRFLVVDDCTTVRNVVRNIIKTRLGSEQVLMATNGKQALQILESQPVDIIISDWQMPELNGEELLYRVRNSARFKDIPFIMMTSNGERDFVITAIQNGVSHFVVKPFRADKLEAAVNKSWNGASKRDSVRHSALPSHAMRIIASDALLEGKVQNISHTGMQVYTDYVDALKLYKITEFNLSFNNFDGPHALSISPLYGTIVRIEANEGPEQDCLLGVRFELDKCAESVRQNLDRLMHKLNNAVPDIVDNH